MAASTLAAVGAANAAKPRFAGMAQRVLARPLFVLGLVLVASLVLLAVFGPFLVTYDPLEQDALNPPLAPPSDTHLLGTDYLGRDALSRLVYGAGISLQVGIAAVVLASIPGVVIGILAAYRGGWVDDVINRVFDALMGFPSLVLALVIVAVLGPSVLNLELAIAIAALPLYARLVRSQVLLCASSTMSRPHALPAREMGASCSGMCCRTSSARRSCKHRLESDSPSPQKRV